MRTEEAPRRGASKRGAGPRASTRWLIVRDEDGRLEPLCVDGEGGRVLPVFSFEEEAEMFLSLGGHEGDGWRARESGIGELVSVLNGPCADVGSVALDPVPGMTQDGTVGLVALARERFVRAVLGGGQDGTGAGAAAHV